jgi:Lrp/AsnC family transcriptional regulator, leucine-responsive regulatory protein
MHPLSKPKHRRNIEERRKETPMSTRTTPDRRNSLQNGNPLLDEVNVRLLHLLADDPRLGVAELARRVAMSAPAVRERLTRLEETGVIRGYRLDVDPAAIGLPVMVWVRIRPGPGQLPRIADLAARTPEVSECHRISGDDCFLLKVHVPAIEALEAILDRFLVHGQTTSSFVVGTPVPPRPVLPSAT